MALASGFDLAGSLKLFSTLARCVAAADVPSLLRAYGHNDQEEFSSPTQRPCLTSLFSFRFSDPPGALFFLPPRTSGVGRMAAVTVRPALFYWREVRGRGGSCICQTGPRKSFQQPCALSPYHGRRWVGRWSLTRHSNALTQFSLL